MFNVFGTKEAIPLGKTFFNFRVHNFRRDQTIVRYRSLMDRG
jgi:hypothetical protein